MFNSFFNILNILAVFQIMTLIIIIRMKSNWRKIENRVFLIFLLLNALLIINSVLNQTVPFGSTLYYILFLFSTSLFLLLGPVFIIFFESIFKIRGSIKFNQLAHLIPVAIFIVIFILLLLKKESNYTEDNEPIFTRLNLLILAISAYIQLLLYIIFSSILLVRYIRGLINYTTAINVKTIHWLWLLISIYFCHWLFDALAFFLPWFDIISSNNAIFFSSIAIFLLLGFITLTFIRGNQGFGVVTDVIDQMKYSGSNLSQKQKGVIKSKLEHIFFEEKLFLNPELTISFLSKSIDIPVKQISQVINETYQNNFFDYINKLRIEYAKSLIVKANKSDKQITFQQIFYDSGFSSKSTFNRAFKKFTGLTPSKFNEKLNSK